MCGIIGAWGHSLKNKDRALSLLSHRGPDNSGIYVDENSGIYLGHTRLSILDLSARANQPMESSDGKLIITFNGEIYNYKELRRELEHRGYKLFSESDTEVLLYLYHCYGTDMLEKLVGIFSFIVWDKKQKQLFAARDAFGVKPLYMNQSKEGIVLGSEIKSMLPMISNPGGFNSAALHRYLTFAWCPGGATPFQNIEKLGPGEAVTALEGKINNRWAWYNLPTPGGSPEIGDDAEYSQAILDAFGRSIKQQLVSDVPVGAFLSGGLDSSAIVALAKRDLPDIKCFTIDIEGGPDAGSENDLPYAKLVANELDVPLEVVTVDPSMFAYDIEKMVYMLDEPQADPAALNVLYMSQLARKQGVKVLLSGVGGDDLFSGYRRHLAIGLENVWIWLPIAIRRKITEGLEFLDSRQPWARRLKWFVSNANNLENRRLAGYFSQTREQDIYGLYGLDFREELGQYSAFQPMLDFIEVLGSGKTKLQKMLAMDQRFFLSDHNLNYVDKMSMAAGVEVRVPFLDRDLVELSSRIPDYCKQRGFTSKWILREAFKDYLPREIIQRPKTGFGLPVRRWLRNELREMLFDYLSSDRLRSRGLFDVEAVRNLMHRNDIGKIDAAYPLFAILCIEIWARNFMDGEAVYDSLY